MYHIEMDLFCNKEVKDGEGRSSIIGQWSI